MTMVQDSLAREGFVEVDWDGRRQRVEFARVGVDDPAAPLMVFLHEGLGSLSMWKDFPQQQALALGWRGLVKVKVGLMLPYTGTYAALGNAITNGFKQFVEENGGKLGGREVEYFTVDDESNPAKATENAKKLCRATRSTCWSAPCTPASRWPWPRSPATPRP
jgi:ABC-type branched-subunit amino acid transport system substrate-binding protein